MLAAVAPTSSRTHHECVTPVFIAVNKCFPRPIAGHDRALRCSLFLQRTILSTRLHSSADDSMDSGTGSEEVDIITFSADDVDDPRNWAASKKTRVLVILCLLTFCATFGSSCYSAAEPQIRTEYGVNALSASTGLTLYVLGFALGPLLCPMSEMYGRKITYTLSWPLSVVFIAPSAFVPNVYVILIFRFFTGACASCALNNGVGVLSDMYSNTPHLLTQAIGWYAFCPLSAPCIGTLVGFFVAAHSPGNQLWAVRVHFFFTVACTPTLFFLPDTHGPTILYKRAEKLRKEGRPNARAAHELHGKTSKEVFLTHITRPFGMLSCEPILQGSAIWMALAYALVYCFLEMYPQVFIVQHRIDFQLGGLFFIPLVIGMLFAIIPYRLSVRFFAGLRMPWLERSPNPIEAKIKIGLWACALIPASLFWFAWTSGSETHWVAPTLSGIPFGYATLIVFFTFSGYSSEVYTIYGSSAAASNTLVRSFFGAAFPIIAHPLIDNLGTKWGLSLFGFLSLGLIPIPLIFIRYGPELRARSHYSREAAEIIRRMREASASPAAPAADEKPVPSAVPSQVSLEDVPSLPEHEKSSSSTTEEV